MEGWPTVSRIKIFGHLNHLGNQYEMLKLAKNYPVKFYWLENNVRKWTKYAPRPAPETWLAKDQFEYVPYYEPGKYDVAILHLDQQAADPYIGKGQLCRQLENHIQDIPKIIMNHGTPMWDEMFTEDMVINGGTIHTDRGDREIDGIKAIVKDNPMIVNSYKAVERWGWGYPLIHGMNPDDWRDLPKEPRITISLSPGGLDKYYNRSLLSAIKSAVKEKTQLDVQHIMVNYKAQDWDDYREFIGRSLIYINPTLDSPMPRSRTEAMFSGCCVLTSRHHNADEFIEQGVNGFIMPDNPNSYAELIYELIFNNYQKAIEVGQAGKDSAKKLFSEKQYQEDLFNIISAVKDGKKLEWNGEKRW